MQENNSRKADGDHEQQEQQPQEQSQGASCTQDQSQQPQQTTVTNDNASEAARSVEGSSALEKEPQTSSCPTLLVHPTPIPIQAYELPNLNMTAEQAQAIAQAAAAAMAASSSASNNPALFAQTNIHTPSGDTSSSSSSAAESSTPPSIAPAGVQLSINDEHPMSSVQQLTAEMLKRELINQKVNRSFYLERHEHRY